MSFLAKLTLGGQDYNILNLDYEVSKPMDIQNRPNGAPRGGLVQMTLESNSRNEVVEWIVSPTMMKNGTITFMKRDATASMKTLDFENAFCVQYREIFDSEGRNPMQMQITLSARVLKINGSFTVTNKWPGMGSDNGSSGEEKSGSVSSYLPD